jgi:tripartite-type tricarboxylate transporter receptor subunit TctC
VRALAATTAKRLEILPNLPTVGEFVPGYEASGLQGVGVPRNTSAEIIEKLNREINAALTEPKMKARLADVGGTVVAGSPAEIRRPKAETQHLNAERRQKSRLITNAARSLTSRRLFPRHFLDPGVQSVTRCELDPLDRDRACRPA